MKIGFRMKLRLRLLNEGGFRWWFVFCEDGL
jgi:hypothetical protein